MNKSVRLVLRWKRKYFFESATGAGTTEDFEPVCENFTDDKSEEKLVWVDDKSEITYFPEFFREELKNPIDNVKHIVTDKRMRKRNELQSN